MVRLEGTCPNFQNLSATEYGIRLVTFTFTSSDSLALDARCVSNEIHISADHRKGEHQSGCECFGGV